MRGVLSDMVGLTLKISMSLQAQSPTLRHRSLSLVSCKWRSSSIGLMFIPAGYPNSSTIQLLSIFQNRHRRMASPNSSRRGVKILARRIEGIVWVLTVTVVGGPGPTLVSALRWKVYFWCSCSPTMVRDLLWGSATILVKGLRT